MNTFRDFLLPFSILVLFFQVESLTNSTLTLNISNVKTNLTNELSIYQIKNSTIKCNLNQELKSCGTACPKTCLVQNPTCEDDCIKDICQCKEGFVVSLNGTCILFSECSSFEKKTCPENSHIVSCGNPCSPTCENPTPTICSLQCVVDACICNEGYVLDHQNNCIKLENCPKKQKICGENEKFFICGTHCEANCDVPFPGFCSDTCLENACQCEFGFVRNQQGKCVLLSECLV